jgi:hypothetical protein
VADGPAHERRDDQHHHDRGLGARHRELGGRPSGPPSARPARGRAFRAAWARLDRRERRKVNLLVNHGEASDDPRLAAAAVALIRLMRVIDPPDRRGDATRAKVFLILFVVVVGLAVWGSVRGSETAWVTWFVACTSLFNLVVFGVVIPGRRRHLPERLAAAERANLETLARETP